MHGNHFQEFKNHYAILILSKRNKPNERKGVIKMERQFLKNFIMNDMEEVNKRFVNIKGFYPDWDAVDDFLKKETETKIFYFDDVLKKVQQDDKKAMYAWLDTGYCLHQDDPVFLALVNNKAGQYIGHFLGTGEFLMNGMCQRNPYDMKTITQNYKYFCMKYKKIIGRRNEKIHLGDESIGTQVMKEALQDVVIKPEKTPILNDTVPNQRTEITQEIYDGLLYPNWKSIDGLDTYIKVIGRRLTQLIEQDKTEYYVLNHIKSAIVNTGLMDQYGTDYLVLYKYHVKKDCYVATRVIHSKLDYLDEKFTREQSNIQLKPISFFDDDQPQWLDATIDDLDFNTRCLHHVVERSAERLPESFKDLSTDRITRILMNAIELGFHFLEKDKNCAKAIYSGGKISWLLPFRVNVNCNEEPELVIVISKNNEFYEVKTILPFDNEIKDKITSLSLYRQWW